MPSLFFLHNPLIGIITGKYEMMARKRKSQCSNDEDFRLSGRRFWRDENDGDSVLKTESWQVCNNSSALVNPHFEYACNAWYRSANAKVKHKIAQNKMTRYLLNYGCRRHIGFSDFKKSNCLDTNARVDYVCLNLMFNIFNNVAPS